ncbi:MAG: TonB-dependent receptor [bacterium]
MTRHSLLRTAVGALLTAVAVAIHAATAAAQTDVIRGKVTTVEGLPLPGVRVTATSIPGNVTRETRTNNQGSFQIAFAGGTGDYIMGYALIGYAFRQFELKRLADEDVLLADAKLSVVQLDTVISTASGVAQRVNRNSPTPDISGTEVQITPSNLPPELQGDLAAMAASLPGVVLVPGLDGGPDGFSVLGLGADQNSTTLNGMQFNSSNLPRDANVSSSLTTSPYDGSRGGFSGGNFNIRPGAGSNFRTRGSSLVLNTRGLEWTDRAAQAVGTEYTNISLGGILSGPITYNKAFYNISYQLGRQSRDNQTLLNTSALGLRTYGLALDSVTHFRSILANRGVPIIAGPQRTERLADNGSAFGSIDLNPPSSTSGQAYGITFNGNWGRQSPIGAGATQLESSAGDRYNWGGGVQLRNSGYLRSILSETQLGVSASHNYGTAYLDLPAGRVLVNSVLADGASGVTSLGFGGNQGLSSSSGTIATNFQNSLSWFDDGNKHRVKLSTELGLNNNSQNQSSNLRGTFAFNSLSDLEAGLPASYTRTLTARRRSTEQLAGAVALGDSYRRSPDLQVQYSLRVDAAHYTAAPAFNENIERVFGARNDRVPSPVVLSPRIGFSYTLGHAQEITAFTGAATAPRAVLRGGIGVFANNAGAGLIGAALDNTGLPGGTQQVSCIGLAAPTPNWAAYATDPGAVPDRCADGTLGTVFSDSAPSVTLFAKHFTPQRSIRSNASWTGSVLDGRFSASLDGTYSINLNQQRSFDLNFVPTTRFTLLDDGRPVYVNPTSIVTTTGSIASRDARVSQAFARVTEIRSDLQSRSTQVTFRLTPIIRGPARFGWSGSYTYSHIREQVSGFSSTAGNPLGVDWAASGQGPHQITYNATYKFFDAVQVSWNGSFRSGNAYTPIVAGDVNGDGYSNDRAFIYSQATAGSDTALVSGMRQLLANASSGTRDCIEKQLGTIAARNSCRAPWSSTASVGVSLDRAKFRMPQRVNISFSLNNPLGAADLVANGSGHLKGWGQSPFPDQSLLYVRGFDPVAKRYIYEVNQRFGATRPEFVTIRQPVVLTTSLRYDLGTVRERQTLAQQLGFGRTLPGSRYPETIFRSVGANSVTNPMSSILRQQDSLRLTAAQADSIASMNRRYNYRSDSLWAPVARYLAALPADYHENEAFERYIRARRAQVDMLMQIVPAIHDVLTPEQRRKLPQLVVNILDPRYLVSIRNGTSLYVGGGTSPASGLVFGFAPGLAEAAMVTFIAR